MKFCETEGKKYTIKRKKEGTNLWKEEKGIVKKEKEGKGKGIDLLKN